MFQLKVILFFYYRPGAVPVNVSVYVILNYLPLIELDRWFKLHIRCCILLEENGVAWPLLHKNKNLKESSGVFTKFSIGGGLTIIFC